MTWIADAGQELSKVNDGVNQIAFLKMHHVIKYVFDTRNLGLKLEPSGNEKEPCSIMCLSNSNYAGDPVSRRSVSGFILCVLGVPILWQSKAQ